MTPGHSPPTPSDLYATERAQLVVQLSLLQAAQHDLMLPSWRAFFATLKNAVPDATKAQLAQIRIVTAGAIEVMGPEAVASATRDL